MEERTYGLNGLKLAEIEDGPFSGNFMECDLVAHIRELLAENAALKADAARLDFLDELPKRIASSDMHFSHGRSILYIRTGIGSGIANSGSGETVREAIDKAMNK